ncbi:MAG: hypothetical protein IJ416_02840 [Ruminiclostridium sp.]|nr:hypothetical protein [Ruminiclostridium sp.]
MKKRFSALFLTLAVCTSACGNAPEAVTATTAFSETTTQAEKAAAKNDISRFDAGITEKATTTASTTPKTAKATTIVTETTEGIITTTEAEAVEDKDFLTFREVFDSTEAAANPRCGSLDEALSALWDNSRAALALLEKGAKQYGISSVTIVLPRYGDEIPYLEINAPENNHEVITRYLTANNVKSGYSYRNAYNPRYKLLNMQTEKTIREDYAEYISNEKKQYTPEDVYVFSYCGMFGGNAAVMMATCDITLSERFTIHEVDGFDFQVIEGCELLLHTDCGFMTIEEAYITNNLTREELRLLTGEFIHDSYAIEKPVPVPAPMTPLTAEAEQILKADYAEFIGSESPDDVYVEKYFGTYNGCETVIMYETNAAATSDMTHIFILGYCIAKGSGCYHITVHKDGGFIDLQEAYNTGIITEEDIQAISYYSRNMWGG